MVKNIGDVQVEEEAFHLRDLLVRTLSTVEGSFESFGVPLPDRRYWTLGRPAEDCAQVVVSFIQMYLGVPGDQANAPQNCNVAPRSAVLEITITRTYPIGKNANSVPQGDIMKAGEWGAVDAWVLMESLPAFDNWDELGRGPGIIATVSARDPSGGLFTTVLNLTVAVP